MSFHRFIRGATFVGILAALQLPTFGVESEHTGHVRDFFFYTCVDEYLRLHGIPQFDGSRALEADYLTLTLEQIKALSNHARDVAESIQQSEHSNDEAIRPAALAICLDESRKVE
jgi:hypothetical protein